MFQNFPLDNQKVRLSVNGFLCAFEIPVPGSPTSQSSPTLTGTDPPQDTGIPELHIVNTTRFVSSVAPCVRSVSSCPPSLLRPHPGSQRLRGRRQPDRQVCARPQQRAQHRGSLRPRDAPGQRGLQRTRQPGAGESFHRLHHRHAQEDGEKCHSIAVGLVKNNSKMFKMTTSQICCGC